MSSVSHEAEHDPSGAFLLLSLGSHSLTLSQTQFDISPLFEPVVFFTGSLLWTCGCFLTGQTDVYSQGCCADASTKLAPSVPEHQGRKTELSIHSVAHSGQLWLTGPGSGTVCQELLDPTDWLLRLRLTAAEQASSSAHSVSAEVTSVY